VSLVDRGADPGEKLRRRLPVLVASAAAVLVAAGVVGVLHRSEWRVGLFVCGAAIGAAGILHSQLLLRVGPTVFRLDAAAVERVHSRLRLPGRVVVGSYAVGGLSLGAVCAALDGALAELLVGFALVVWWIFGFAVLMAAGRRTRRSSVSTS